MSGLKLALPPQRSAAPAIMNAAMPVSDKRQGHPDRFPCFQCSEHFANAVGRAAHMRTAHDNENGFLCHECFSSCGDRRQDAHHANDHFRSRFSPPQMACTAVGCTYRSSSKDVMDRHRREDHKSDGSHQGQCPECAYHNDSVVGVSVHKLHVHSEGAVAKREEALKLKRASEAAIKRAARRAKAARKAEDNAVTDASSSTIASSPTETDQDKADSESSPAETPTSKKRRCTPSPLMNAEQLEEVYANDLNSNALLEQQLAALRAMTEEERAEVMMTHRERKMNRKARALAVKKARRS